MSVTTGSEFSNTKETQPKSRFEHHINSLFPDSTRKVEPIAKCKPERPVEAYFSEHEEIRGEDDFMFLLWGSPNSERCATYAVVAGILDTTPWITAAERYLHEECVFSSLRDQSYANVGLLR